MPRPNETAIRTRKRQTAAKLQSGGSGSAGTEACTTSSRGRSSIRRGNPQGSAASRTASTVGDPVTVTDRGADRGSRHRHAPTPTLELRAAIDTPGTTATGGALDADQLVAELKFGRLNQPMASPTRPLRQPADTTAPTVVPTRTTGRPA